MENQHKKLQQAYVNLQKRNAMHIETDETKIKLTNETLVIKNEKLQIENSKLNNEIKNHELITKINTQNNKTKDESNKEKIVLSRKRKRGPKKTMEDEKRAIKLRKLNNDDNRFNPLKVTFVKNVNVCNFDKSLNKQLNEYKKQCEFYAETEEALAEKNMLEENKKLEIQIQKLKRGLRDAQKIMKIEINGCNRKTIKIKQMKMRN
eukprot:UN33177